MSKQQTKLHRRLRLLLLLVVFAAVISIIVQNIAVFANILLVVIGFGAVVLVHEFGHFVVAKLSDIEVEAFSMGFPPTLIGIKRTQRGFRFRILPNLFPTTEDDQSDGSLLSFTIGKKAKAGETEYRIGLVPFGGFVKMLGQEDVKEVEKSDDPRSYANKPATTRMAVIAAGVIFNVISAVVIFMIVFLIGINLTPPVVGGIIPGSPAEHAELKPGDEVIEVAGKSYNLDFMKIVEAAALSGKDQTVALKVRHQNGSVEKFSLVAERLPGEPMRVFGITSPLTLTIAKLSADDAESLFERTGLKPGDRIKSVNGVDVETHFELAKVIEDSFEREATVLVQRTDKSGEVELVETELALEPVLVRGAGKSETELGHIYSMVPRMRVDAVLDKQVSLKNVLTSLFKKRKSEKAQNDLEEKLKEGDVILAVGSAENPTYEELRDVVTEYEDKELPVRVLRADPNGVENIVATTVVPVRSPGSDRVMMGIAVGFDMAHPVVAKTISTGEGEFAFDIPRGAAITAVDGVAVSDFYDCLREIRRNIGQRVNIEWRVDDELAGGVALEVTDGPDSATIKTDFAEFIPFKPLERLYKATGPFDAVRMGCDRAAGFITQSFMTLRRFFTGIVSAKNFMGPVGIAKISYDIVKDYPLIYYAYFLGLINAFIAVFNSLPLLPFDGGHIVFLLVERIKGSAVNERVQAAFLYFGLVIVLAFVLYVTFNDIVRSFF